MNMNLTTLFKIVGESRKQTPSRHPDDLSTSKTSLVASAASNVGSEGISLETYLTNEESIGMLSSLLSIYPSSRPVFIYLIHLSIYISFISDLFLSFIS